jgi:hypothetical protein
MSAAPLLPLAGEAVGEAAATQAVTLIVIEGGGAGAAATTAAGAGAATVGGGAAIGVGAIAATAGAAIVVIGVAALAVWLYKRSHPVPTRPKAVVPCPLGEPAEPVPNPNIGPKPVPLDERIPKVNREKIAKRVDERCKELWESIHRRTNRRRKKQGSGTQGMKYRYWDMICSEFNPNDPNSKNKEGVPGSEIWDDHKQSYENDRAGLQSEIEEFEQKCQGDLPEGANEYANNNFPDKSEWKGDSPECIKYRAEREQRYDKYKYDPNANNG